MLSNSRITVSAAARGPLAAGLVDLRLLATIAFVAGQHPLDIIGFGSVAPGADPGVPTRVAYLAEADAAANMSGSSYVSALEAALRAETPPYIPLRVQSTQLPGGQTVLEIEFSAPSPLNLLHS